MFGLWWFVIVIAVIIIGVFIFHIIKDMVECGCLCLDDWVAAWIALTGAILVSAILVPVSIFVPLKGKKEYIKYLQDYQMIKEVIAEGTDYENFAINQTIIEYNSWLSNARADKETYGCWSEYVYVDLDKLNYINK